MAQIAFRRFQCAGCGQRYDLELINSRPWDQVQLRCQDCFEWLHEVETPA